MINSSIDIMDPANGKFKDECGVFGIYVNKPVDVASVTYYGLYALQHRGQESAGIAVANGEEVKIHKGLGLITEAFNSDNLDYLKNYYRSISGTVPVNVFEKIAVILYQWQIQMV